MADGLSRKIFVAGVGASLGGLALGTAPAAVGATGQTIEMPFANGTRALAAYPQKRPLIVLTSRPVQLETPFDVFDDALLTPNDAFFVRWHLAGVPTTVDPSTYSLTIRGLVDRPTTISLSDLKSKFEAAEVKAVCLCAGNGRGFFQPRVPGGQWGYGAMGNARWRGARLKDVMNRAGLSPTARFVRFNGMDKPVLADTPKFMKSLDLATATNDDVLVAYEMNGEPLPLLNGFPVRLVVPGWFGTYWVKMLNDIEAIAEPDTNFWMSTAYRIPDNACACQEPGTKVPTVPISKINPHSYVTNLQSNATVARQGNVMVRGIAFDGGSGIAAVKFSSDGGGSWTQATLGTEDEKFSFRQWSASFSAQPGRRYALQSAATGNDGATQSAIATWNASGYQRNVIESVVVEAAS